MSLEDGLRNPAYSVSHRFLALARSLADIEARLDRLEKLANLTEDRLDDLAADLGRLGTHVDYAIEVSPLEAGRSEDARDVQRGEP